MTPSEYLLVIGASARAAAFSALRAALRPECADLFADADLQARCPARPVAAKGYPRSFLALPALREAGPWIYTGALENRPNLIDELARRRRPLWGNPAGVLQRVRSPFAVREALRQSGLPCPAVWTGTMPPPASGRWLLKPLYGAGGSGIRPWTGRAPLPRWPFYWQQLIDGEPCAAVYVGDCQAARLLGVTKQLVGEPWLNAAPFHYCGSVGPLELEPPLQELFTRTGAVLAKDFGLRGLFGVDCVVRDGVPYPVEVNPRYTASVEVIEYATGLCALALHRAAFEASGGRKPPEFDGHTRGAFTPRSPVVGKAVLFARTEIRFPAEGPWTNASAGARQMPKFADIPHAGDVIGAGKPILTLFQRGQTMEDCLEQLRRKAADLDRGLTGR
jgi:predicted ATP-grasp superfamily ATP-dependent carboligase